MKLLAQRPPTKKYWSWQFNLSIYLPYRYAMLPLVSVGWVMAPMTLVSEHGYSKPAWWGRRGGKELIGNWNLRDLRWRRGSARGTGWCGEGSFSGEAEGYGWGREVGLGDTPALDGGPTVKTS